MATHPKRPRDPFQLAKLIGDISTGEIKDKDPNAGKSPAAIARGKAGGAKGVTAAVVIVALGGSGPAISTNADVNASGIPGAPGVGVSATICMGGNGGSSLFGAGGLGSNAQNAGAAAIGNGAGGAGGCCINGGASIGGGVGTQGLICVDEYS